ncbi:formate/nitrite transporter family protein [Tetragenococcus koreensis]|uniref:formate/nitrite transporter family protein n=1 Tax=Tetragenococcus koreensis TaxID=290335 RepID=UPI001F1CAD18|nr:formate/nitrite transporter family protein [Tetragenococcus koreensis]MCF1616654.1 formate/nitrite transporter family protein [Tetragenococcus koreensis]MCF1621679.1 formate/nitrite transporter family protein [Tetragenococcus koreensis]MCF1627057.1 formate/nitrite transporter family protein [Tetragenococcus koreensis]MCF1630934.1 formate/nitrite transporter family protein [Tetragenococcus koreensis]MCF1677664.1 formate/nitrite transporter family protein [Tetragenococcus koreensis]
MNSISALFEKIDSSIIKKVDLIESSYTRYAVRAVLACLFLTLGTAIAFGTAMKAEEVAPGSGKFLYAFMFSWSLVMILYMNAELGTSNMLYMTVGVYRKKIDIKIAGKILFTCILFNLIGGIFFGYLISLTGTFQNLPADNFMFTSLANKLEKSTIQILVEGVFANIVVNTAVLVSLRMKDDAGKVLAIIFIIFIFAFLGYEHVIANFPAFSLGYFASHGAISTMTTANLIHNILFALLGNYIGGGLVIGLVYAWLNNTKSDYVD